MTQKPASTICRQETGLHRRLHTNVYYLYVDFMVVGAYVSAVPGTQKQNVERALGIIKGQLVTINALCAF